MLKKEDCYWLGTLVKTHGIKGELVIKLNNLLAEDLIEMESVFLEIEGLLVPFFIETIYAVTSQTCIVQFERLNSESKSTEFTGCRVYTDKNITDIPDNIPSSLSEFIGFNIEDTQIGFHGIIDDVLDVSKNPLFRVLYNNQEVLIPAQPGFIIRIDDKKKIIYVSLPDGLLDINN
jgi:16S rRNA processing protein RimM